MAPHAFDGPFDSERLGEVGDRGFRRGRMRRPRAACPRECRADVQDGAGAPCGQPATMQLLRTEKGTAENDLCNRPPPIRRNVLGGCHEAAGGVVAWNSNRSERRLSKPEAHSVGTECGRTLENQM